MNFLEAMKLAKEGTRVARSMWSSSANVSYDNDDLLWSSKDHPSQHYHPMSGDIFADDWSVL